MDVVPLFVCLFARRSHLDVAFVRALWKANESLFTYAHTRARQADRNILFNYSGNRILVYLCLLCAVLSLPHMPSVFMLLMRVQVCLCVFSICVDKYVLLFVFWFFSFWTIQQHRNSFGFWVRSFYNKWKSIFIELLALIMCGIIFGSLSLCPFSTTWVYYSEWKLNL